MGKCWIFSFIFLVSFVGWPVPAWAKPVHRAMAQEVAQHWAGAADRHLDQALHKPIKQCKEFKTKSGDVAYYAVDLEKGGYIIVAADDNIEPIIAFSDEGAFEPDPENPLFQMLQHDMPTRVRKAQDWDRWQAAVTTRGASSADFMIPAMQSAREKWNRFKAKPSSKQTGKRGAQDLDQTAVDDLDSGTSSISDVRVAPLVQTKWSQGNVSRWTGTTWTSANVYNYYTPNHYVCGCVATATAQLLRFHQHQPAGGIGRLQQSYYVNSSATSGYTRGGDGNGGAYNWALMPAQPSANSGQDLTLAMQQQIGALCYDAGLAVRMNYASGGSGASSSLVDDALRNVFGYANALMIYDYNSVNSTTLGKVLKTNLSAGMPTYLSIRSSSAGGHAVICDGYGYNAGTLYHHVNLGWGGAQDAWYNLPTIDAGYLFDVIKGVIYNIFPTQTGEIISGRVLDESGNPIAGAIVTATGGYSATADANGNYGVIVPSNQSYDLTATRSGYSAQTLYNRAVGTSSTTSCGNVEDADFTLSPFSLSAVALSDRVLLRWSAPSAAGMLNDTVYIRSSTSGYPTAGTGTEIYTGSAQTYEHSGLTPGTTYYYTVFGNDGAPYASFQAAPQVSATPEATRTRLYLRHSDGRLCVWQMGEDGSLQTRADRSMTSVPVSADWSIKQVADINGDTTPDLILRNAANGRIMVWFIGKDGYLSTAPSAYAINEVVSLDWTIDATVDVNRDSTPDLILRNRRNGRILVWFMGSDGTLSTDPSAYTINEVVSLDWTVQLATDVDGDAVPDLILRNKKNGRILVWFMAANGSLSTDPSAYTINEVVSLDWTVQLAIDVDGDAVPDLILRNKKNGRILVWFMATDGSLSTHHSAYTINEVVSMDWILQDATCVDSDSVPDLILRNQRNGRVLTWFMASDGTLSTDPSAYSATDNVGTNWTLQKATDN